MEQASVVRTIGVIGLGFVGQTLAVKLADTGFTVYGVENNRETLAQLAAGRSHVMEPGLNELLERHLGHRLHLLPPDGHAFEGVEAWVVSVGTDDSTQASAPHLQSLRSATSWLSSRLQRGQLVVVRSTVPIGTTRHVVLPLLAESGLHEARDFALAFCPERTAEGAALAELSTLPQVIGALDEESGFRAGKIFREVTPHIMHVSSLEAAEAVKLIDNSYRDVRFGFANTIAHLCEEAQLDAFELICVANQEYPRNSIPVPSPGVGGSCLPKDSRFLMYSAAERGVDVAVMKAARRINESMPRRLVTRLGSVISLHDVTVAVAGFAFKGVPETNDTRESPTWTLVAELIKSGSQVIGYDPVVAPEVIATTGAQPAATLEAALSGARAVVFMTNHTDFSAIAVDWLAARVAQGTMVVDGWGLFPRREVEAAGLRYLGVGVG